MSSPRAWGCFLTAVMSLVLMSVFPTCVGVFPRGHWRRCSTDGLPHVRGGVSKYHICFSGWTESSPRAWGCFLSSGKAFLLSVVFPTCVGVFPHNKKSFEKLLSLPHVRGGVSRGTVGHAEVPRSSPRAWGCFQRALFPEKVSTVFPTCVGVFPALSLGAGGGARLPHVRGGVSTHIPGYDALGVSSPRAWGCFLFFVVGFGFFPVFPTCVGVFLTRKECLDAAGSLPHVRGGVSVDSVRKGVPLASSPRAWGCFRLLDDEIERLGVFPTCVGVFRNCTSLRPPQRRLPHVRGGVSYVSCGYIRVNVSSPRAWGCFHFHEDVVFCGKVFPTCVGVFLSKHCPMGRSGSLPHVRGGVSP